MAQIAGEALLAVTGIAIALEPGPVRLNKGLLGRAQGLPVKIQRQLRRFLTKPGFEDAEEKPLPPFDYDAALKVLTLPITEPRIRENVEGFPEQALADSYAAALGRAWAFLQQQIPIRTRKTLLGTKNIDPPALTLASFRRKYSVIETPMVVLDDLGEGSLIRDMVETLETVYPGLYDFIRDQAITLLAEVKAAKGPSWELPYAKDRLLQTLLQTTTMDPRLLRDIQSVYKGARGGKDGPGPKKVDIKDNLTTASQRVSEKGAEAPG